MPDFVVGEDDHPENSDYRFVVLGHPELGEFTDWDSAVAQAWTVTPAGGRRAEVTLAPRGVLQVKTSDPDDDDLPNPMDGILFDGEHARIHQVERFDTDWIAHTYCGQSRPKNQWSTYNPALDGTGYTPCPGCSLPSVPEHTVLDREDSTASVHVVIRAQEDVEFGAYQLRCGRIALWRDCIDVPDPKNSARCGWCFDPLLAEPPKPVRW